MLNIFPHQYKNVAGWIFTCGIICNSNFGCKFLSNYLNSPEYITNFLIATAFLLYFGSKDEIADEYVDMLKLRSVCIVFIASAVIGFLFNNVSTSLSMVASVQVIAYLLILKFSKYSESELRMQRR